MTCTAAIPVVTLARDLPTELQRAAWDGAASLAWANNVCIAIAGQDAGGSIVLCVSCEVCNARPGAVVVVPDVEVVSRWGSVPTGRTECSSTAGSDSVSVSPHPNVPTLGDPYTGRTAYVFAGSGPRR